MATTALRSYLLALVATVAVAAVPGDWADAVLGSLPSGPCSEDDMFAERWCRRALATPKSSVQIFLHLGPCNASISRHTVRWESSQGIIALDFRQASINLVLVYLASSIELPEECPSPGVRVGSECLRRAFRPNCEEYPFINRRCRISELPKIIPKNKSKSDEARIQCVDVPEYAACMNRASCAPRHPNDYRCLLRSRKLRHH